MARRPMEGDARCRDYQETYAPIDTAYTSKNTRGTKELMNGVIVTGANRGIGFGICEKLLKETDVAVYLGCRDYTKGEEAEKALRNAGCDGTRMKVLLINPADLESCKMARNKVKDHEAVWKLLGVINNAGMWDKLENTMAINYFGVRNMWDTFEPLIPDGGRFHLVTSASGPMYVSSLDEADQPFWRNPKVTLSEVDSVATKTVKKKLIDDSDAYGFSKACCNAMMLALSSSQNRVLVNSCTPGFINTGMTTALAQAKGLESGADLGAKPIEHGAKTPVFSFLEGKHGMYYGSDQVISPLHVYRGPGDPPYEPLTDGALY